MSTRPLFATLFAVACLTCAALVRAEGPDESRRWAAAIRDLGSDKPERRDDAQAELAAAGEDARAALEQALSQTKDPEIGFRVRALLATLDEQVWGPILLKALKEDADFLNALRTVHEDANFVEVAGRCIRIAAESDLGLLTEPARFFRIAGDVYGYHSKPVEYFRIALTRSGKAVLLDVRNRRFDGRDALRRILVPVTTTASAARAAILAAKVLVFCAECLPDAQVNLAACTTEARPEGGWRVTIPKEALDDTRREESAEVTFDAEGRLLDAIQTGHPMGHK